MPIYEYVCKECSQPFEALIRGNEKPKCPHCGGVRLAKQLSVPSAPSQSAGACMFNGGSSPPPPS